MSFAKNEVVVFPATQLSCSSGPFSGAWHRGALWPGAVYPSRGPLFLICIKACISQEWSYCVSSGCGGGVSSVWRPRCHVIHHRPRWQAVPL